MEIKFNITGTERKKLVTAVSEIVGWAPVYKKAPTFEYAVSNYIIDKNGTLKGDITQELLNALAERGFAASENGAVFETEAATEQAAADIPELAPEADTGGDSAADEPNNDAPTETSGSLIIELPKDGFTDETVANLEKLIASKAGLIKKALGAENLTVEQTETTLRFPWFGFEPDTNPDAANAYARFIRALCDMAKEQKRVTAKEKEVENEKYAFRCFLLRLGFIGNDCKTERKILLEKLSGNGAFKSGRPPAAAVEAELEAETGESAAFIEEPANLHDRKVMA